MIARLIILFVIPSLFGSDARAQFRRFGGWSGRGGSAEPYSSDRGNVPQWELDRDLPHDCFMWARIKYRSWTQHRSFTWYTDYRDSDLNMSFRLQQLTALKVDPEGAVVEITDPHLNDYPFVFMSGVGGLELNDEEATDPFYFETFSEPQAYPIGFNVIFYAMTH